MVQNTERIKVVMSGKYAILRRYPMGLLLEVKGAKINFNVTEFGIVHGRHD